ncbi:MAG: MFS transporter [Alphaproteobacteria bacterium]
MSPVRLVAVVWTAQVLGMLSISTFAALLPGFIAEWQLTNTQAGWISGVFFGGYTAAVPVLVSLTDRVDPRRIYLISTALGGLAALGFALYAEGFWTAMLFRALAGIGIAGTYMPGLKALSDRIEGPSQPRAIAIYTSGFGIGTALSFLMTGEVAAWLDWHWAFGLAAAGSALAFVIVALALPKSEPHHLSAPETDLLDFRPVLRNRSAMAYILCYMVHAWELFVQRSWVVAFLFFAQARHGAEAWVLSPTVIATVMNLLGVWASITGNELSMRFGRRRFIFLVMAASVVLCSFIGFTAGLPYALVVALCLVHGVTVSGESASLTAGAVGTATPGYRGATMALHSTLGFAGGFMGPLAFGLVLDVAGGESVLGWGLAFASVAAVMAGGPLILALLRPAELAGDGRAGAAR